MTPVETIVILLAGHAVLIAFGVRFLSGAPFRTRIGYEIPDPAFLRACLPWIALFCLVLLAHVVEIHFDVWLAEVLALDFTRDIHGFERDLPAAFQSIVHPVLDLLFVGIYIFTYVFLIYFTPAFFVLHRERHNLALYVCAFAIGWLLALPFFLFLPMHDPWSASLEPWYVGTPVDFGLGRIWPDVLEGYYRFTSPNNELPSFHSQLSAMCAGVAWLSGHRRLAYFATFCALTIPITSLYLGLHWLTDIGVGQLFAAVSVAAAWRLTRPLRAQAVALEPRPVAGPREHAPVEASTP
ncbi:MAG TPA: phosphatase PAP2 family protein [Candidatus Thermoplasmatota archaeon]|nr:phosphatase PAP2 family protein [Candidatus Thermoplasmatota archaeon]